MLEFKVKDQDLKEFGCRARRVDHAHVFLYESDDAYVTHVVEVQPSFKSYAGYTDKATPQETLEQWANKRFGKYGLDSSECEVVVFYPRCFKPLPNYVSNIPQAYEFIDAREQTLDAVKILIERTLKLFETIAPVPSHSKVYGHRIREILLLACMEVESAWTAILRANQYERQDKSGNTLPESLWKTSDYVKLQAPLKLEEFAVSFRRYPEWPKFHPFKSWNTTRPTKSIPWYDAYNQTKHNRESAFDVAQLQYAVEAVGAALILTYVQFGNSARTIIDTMQLEFCICPFFYLPRMEIKQDGNGKLVQGEKGYHQMVPGKLSL